MIRHRRRFLIALAILCLPALEPVRAETQGHVSPGGTEVALPLPVSSGSTVRPARFHLARNTDRSASRTDATYSSESHTRRLWDENYPFYLKILNMPFNRELLSGRLDEKIFRNYIIQDYHYLQNYRKVYGILLAKAPDETAARFIVTLIHGIDEEIARIHHTYMKKLHISGEELSSTPPYPSTEFYNSFLIKTAALEPFEVGLAATLPCHWIYYQLGVDMKKSQPGKESKYREWIDGYGAGPWEDSETKKVVDFVEDWMRKTTDETRSRMKKAYETAMKLEYLFWDGVYRDVKWVE